MQASAKHTATKHNICGKNVMTIPMRINSQRMANSVLIFSPRYPLVTLINAAQHHAKRMEHQHDGGVYAYAYHFGGDKEVF